jgi:glutathione S-transferase
MLTAAEAARKVNSVHFGLGRPLTSEPARDPPVLWHFRVSHYNEKVRWALDHKRWPHHRRAMIPGFHLPWVRVLSGQNRLPVLRIGRRTLADSTAIIAALEALRPDPPLYPAEPAALARALALEDYFDEEVAPELRRLFWWAYVDRPTDCAKMATDGFGPAARVAFRASWPLTRPLFRRNMGLDAARIEAARRRLAAHFDRLEAEIGASGFLVGERFGIADLSAAAVMTAIIRPPEFSYPLPEPWPPALAALRASVAQRAGFRWVQEIYRAHRGRSFEIGADAAVAAQRTTA